MKEPSVRVTIFRSSFWDVEVESSAVGQDMVDLFERWFVGLENVQMPRPIINQWVYQR